MRATPPAVVSARCASCHRDVELVCEGLAFYPGYATFHEYYCPHCRKRNHERTPGAIREVRPARMREAAA